MVAQDTGQGGEQVLPINSNPWNQIVHGDCIEQMQALPEGSVDLVFADPPFNIGYEYDVYRDDRDENDYLKWSNGWITAVHRVLKDTGTFWLAIGDEYAAELKILSQQVGFKCRSWVIWYYTFGVNCKTKFSRSHAHLFYFVKNSKSFTFRADELDNRIPSARQLVYADPRANPTGRLPDDTWVLRPQDLTNCFTTGEDTWYLPRVAGTFKERAGFHGCQMPEQLLGRIIRLCSNDREKVLDPFSGSATTVAVAKKLGRSYLGFDLSDEYVKRGGARQNSICVGDALEGSAEPTLSAPATPTGKGRKSLVSPSGINNNDPLTLLQQKLYHNGLLEAFRTTHDGYSVDRIVADPDLNIQFVEACQRLALPGDARTWNWTLFGMRKSGIFAEIPTSKRTEFSWESCDQYLFASEIAWGQLVKQDDCDSLDSILCDPHLAARFDDVARMWAPGFSPLQYRWAALKLRKSSMRVRSRAQQLTDAHMSRGENLDKPGKLRLPDAPGVYIVFNEQEAIYAGEANNLRDRVTRQFSVQTKNLWDSLSSLTAKFFPTDCHYSTRLAYQWRLVNRHRPKLNLIDSKI